MYPMPYNVGGTVLSRVPTLQKLPILQRFLAPPQLPVALIILCIIGATYSLLLLNSLKSKTLPVSAYIRNIYLSSHSQTFCGSC